MEEYLLRTLDQEERVRLKLLNPLNVGLRLAARYKEAAFERLKLLSQDIEALQSIDRQLALFHQEMLRDFEPRLARLDLLLSEMEGAGPRFFEETMRLGRIRSLLDSEAVQRAFEREVIGDTPQQIEAEVGRIIDWIVERNLQVWQDVSQFVDRRRPGPAPGGHARRGAHDASPTTARRCSTRWAGCPARWSAATTARPRRGPSPTKCRARSPPPRWPRRAPSGWGRWWRRSDRSGRRRHRHPARGGARGRRVLLHPAQAPPGAARVPATDRRAADPAHAKGSPGRCTRRSAQSTERVNEAIAPYRRFVESQQQRINEARGELVAAEDALLRLRGEIERR